MPEAEDTMVEELHEKGKSKGKPDSAYDADELAMGVKVEMEHGLGRGAAREIAKDHLEEMPDYYTRLKKMEKKTEKAMAEISSRLAAIRKGGPGSGPRPQGLATARVHRPTNESLEGSAKRRDKREGKWEDDPKVSGHAHLPPRSSHASQASEFLLRNVKDKKRARAMQNEAERNNPDPRRQAKKERSPFVADDMTSADADALIPQHLGHETDDGVDEVKIIKGMPVCKKCGLLKSICKCGGSCQKCGLKGVACKCNKESYTPFAGSKDDRKIMGIQAGVLKMKLGG